MMDYFKKIILLSCFILIGAMSASAYTVSGSVIDENGDPLPEASVRLLNAKDSTYVKGAAANIDGIFSLRDIKSGQFIIETSYLGYAKSFADVTVKSSNVKVDPIMMTEASHMLAEATVVGVKTPIKVMEDTIEYNADSYKTQPNAVVEDLLKRLPGVEVGSDGAITANGKSVTKILIDGKEFFADDPKVASKNIPVNMVEKLQVVERKSDLARLTGVDDGEDETVINLTVKPGMQNGWFGAAEAGYGTDKRYKGTFNINRFWNGNQITFIGNANNTNELGFTDGNGSRFRRFGGDQGINNSQSFGVNFNVGKEEIVRFGGDVMYSHTDKDTRQRQNRQYLLDEDSYEQNSLNDSRDRGHNIRADFRIEWKPDSFNTFDFRPNFSYNQNDSWSNQFSIAEGKSTSLNRADSDGKSYEAGGRLIYNHNFRQRRGRSFSVHANYRFSNVHEYENSYVYNLFHLNDSLDYYDQFIDNRTWSNSIDGRLSWTEPIGDASKGRFLTFAYSLRYNWNNADKLVYDRPVDLTEQMWSYILSDKEYLVPMPEIDYANPILSDTLSNRFRNTTFRQDIRAGFKLVKPAYNLDAGFSVSPTRSQSINLTNSAKTIPTRWVWNYAPYMRFRYKFSKTASVNVDYFGRSSQPSMSQLQDVPDYSNPLNITVGNPELVPTFSHNIRLRHQDFNMDHQRSIMTMLDAQVQQDAIIQKTIYNIATGGRTTTYENVNGVWNARLMNMFSQPLSNKKWTFNNNIFTNFNQTIGYSNGMRNRSQAFGIAESFSFAFRPDNLELELRPNYFFQTTHNSISSLDTSNTHRYGASFNGTWYGPLGFVLATDMTFSALRGYASGYNDDSWMWNASISYQFLKGRQATVMLKVYDILQQKSDINRTITASYIDNTQYNALTRYFMLSFTYKFNTFGGGKTPEDRNSNRWGPPGGGPGGPGGRRR